MNEITKSLYSKNFQVSLEWSDGGPVGHLISIKKFVRGDEIGNQKFLQYKHRAKS